MKVGRKVWDEWKWIWGLKKGDKEIKKEFLEREEVRDNWKRFWKDLVELWKERKGRKKDEKEENKVKEQKKNGKGKFFTKEQKKIKSWKEGSLRNECNEIYEYFEKRIK